MANNLQRVLVSGASGYIGRQLVSSLAATGKFSVIALSRRPFSIEVHPKVTWIFGENHLHPLQGSKLNFDSIVHLAGMTPPPRCEQNPIESFEANFKTLEYFATNFNEKNLIFVSTNCGYGSNPCIRKDVYDEDSLFCPISVYGKHKFMAEQLLQTVHRRWIIVRPASVFGLSPFMKNHLLIHFLVRQAVRGEIEIYEPHARRNFIHLLDFCDAISFLLERFDFLKNSIFNIGDPRLDKTKFEIVSWLRKLGCRFEVRSKQGSDLDNRDYVVSNERLLNSGWLPTQDIDKSVIQLIEYYQHSDL